jgi:hypothetical protein
MGTGAMSASESYLSGSRPAWQQITPRIVIRPAHVSDSDFVAGLVSSLL